MSSRERPIEAGWRWRRSVLLALLGSVIAAAPAVAVGAVAGGGEASLAMPDLGQVRYGAVNGRALLWGGLVVCGLGLLFGLAMFRQVRRLPTHAAMHEVAELI
jgi:K(+)-stimulated pyrophosphate-energized sodium pump